MPRKTEQHSIVTPELWDAVSKENKELMNEFVEYCKSTSKSPQTIEGYTNDIMIFYVWNLQNNNNKFFIDLTKRDVMKYQNWLVNDLKVSSNRVRRLKSSISSMSKFIEAIMDDLYPDFRPIINKVPAPPKQDVRDKTVLSDEQVDYLLNYLVEKGKYQQACAVALAVASGSRKSEILRFKVSYFVDENIKYNALYKTPEKIKTKGRSLGKYIYRYVLVKQFKPYFDLWMKQREELGIVGEELFWNKRNGVWKPADIVTLNSWSLTFSKILGVDWYWHCNRHYFTTALCQANIPADIIKDIIGWESTDMVSIYNDTEVDDEIGKYFDADGIKQNEVKKLSDL
jgi:site-specific recombinase XerD